MNKIPTAMAIVASIVLLGSVAVLSPLNRAYAHTFKGDENMAFLSMVQQIKTETSLAGNNTSDKDIANHHIEHVVEALTNATLKEISEKNQRIATDLPANIEQLKTMINSSNATAEDINSQVQQISGLLDEAVQVRIDPAQVTNSTVQALVVASMLNEALEHYGEAIGFEGNMTNMSTMIPSGQHGTAMHPTSNASNIQANSTGASNTGATKIVSVPNYQSAVAFSEKAQNLYQQIKAKAQPGKENAIRALDSSFPAFIKAIKDKAPAMEVASLAHLRIHPNLMEAYNLKLAP